MSELGDPYEPMVTEANGLGPADVIARAREALAPVRDALDRAGFYAYGTIDDENRWVISADDEAGHVDVRVGPDGEGAHADVEWVDLVSATRTADALLGIIAEFCA